MFNHNGTCKPSPSPNSDDKAYVEDAWPWPTNCKMTSTTTSKITHCMDLPEAALPPGVYGFSGALTTVLAPGNSTSAPTNLAPLPMMGAGS
eukprot:CAMPEP_0115201830 /NCGR_PEP_ID=MMETSP0270-20121206/17823_1 /TAXON_ID=71861 /ORGANISM="Scrippsiella trochoidea, Strain CCMP3099" /LENGTH=90 /DNA_ID=CAMNT_0002615245 /DNA_START=50 /DNA_END=319 /DNA_ORIENTATION=-